MTTGVPLKGKESSVAPNARENPVIGFIGIGSMGAPMASRLIRAGMTVWLYDTNRGAAENIAKSVGGAVAETLAYLGERVDIAITMLPTSDIVEGVIFGPQGLVGSLRAGSLLLEMSSGLPARTAEMGKRLQAVGIRMVDAPVSGGVKRAVSGDLAIMTGGPESDIEAIDPILRLMGKSIVRTGGLGSGQAMKALNNMASAASLLVSIEVMEIGKRLGLDPAVMVDVLNVSSGKSNSSELKLKQYVISKAFNSGFSLDLMVKDLNTAMTVAKETQTKVPLSEYCQALWKEAASTLGPGRDHTEIARFTEAKATSVVTSVH